MIMCRLEAGGPEEHELPAQDREILCGAGFSDVELFFTAFTWRGWIAYA